MSKLNRVLQTIFCTVILVSGVFLFTHQNAVANLDCDEEKSYGGEEDPITYECIKKEVTVDCFVCVADPIGN